MCIGRWTLRVGFSLESFQADIYIKVEDGFIYQFQQPTCLYKINSFVWIEVGTRWIRQVRLLIGVAKSRIEDLCPRELVSLCYLVYDCPSSNFKMRLTKATASATQLNRKSQAVLSKKLVPLDDSDWLKSPFIQIYVLVHNGGGGKGWIGGTFRIFLFFNF